MKYEIQPLSKEEVSDYIDHHMKIAGAKKPIFTEVAIEAIVFRSQGWPSVINTITVNSLLFRFQLKKNRLMRKS
jgi:type II secretory pathway predicted ATPase ExeA